MKREINKKLIITLLILLVIIITGVILFFTTDIFRTKRGIFFRYFGNTTDALEVFENDDYKEYKKKKQDIPYIRKAEVKIQSSSNIADSNILDKLKLSITQKNDDENEKANIEATLNSSNKKVVNISAIKNKDIYGVFCSDISNAYIGVKNENLKRIAEDIGIPNTMIVPNELNNLKVDKIIETSKLEKKHINECLKIMKNGVPTTAYKKEGKKKIKINEYTYNTNAYSLSLNANDSANLQISLLEKISKDSILMDYFASKFKLMNFDEEYTTVNSLNSIIKNRIDSLRKNPSEGGELKIIVYEHKQKDIRTEIKLGDNTIKIDHVKDEGTETSSLKINNQLYEIQYNGTNYCLIYQNDSEEGNTKKIKIEYSQDGKIEDNNIKNSMTINVEEGIKSITYLYTDSIEFTKDIGEIKGADEDQIVILNDYKDSEIKEFINSLKKKINGVYISKGAEIGINLDPLFEIQ